MARELAVAHQAPHSAGTAGIESEVNFRRAGNRPQSANVNTSTAVPKKRVRKDIGKARGPFGQLKRANRHEEHGPASKSLETGLKCFVIGHLTQT